MPGKPIQTTHGLVHVIEYDGRRPFSAQSSAEGSGRFWDLEGCRRDGVLYYDKSGFGAGATQFRVGTPRPKGAKEPLRALWIATGVSLIASVRVDGQWGEREVPWSDAPRYGYRLLRRHRGDPFAGAVESDTVYCETCDDWLPTEDTDTPCDHVWWCEEHGWWTGATGDPCECAKEVSDVG